MNKKLIGATLVALPLAVGGYVAATSQGQVTEKQTQVAEDGYICPVTGEELPCPKCCPLNKAE
jgi:hypothetical protein